MNYSKIFHKQMLLLYLLLMAGCMSLNTGPDIDPVGNSEIAADSESERSVPENPGPEIAVSVLPLVSEIEEPVEIVSVPSVEDDALTPVVSETVVWAAPEEDTGYPEPLLPEVRIKVKQKELLVFPTIFHFYEMGPQENEVVDDYFSNNATESLTRPEIVIETATDKNLKPADSVPDENVNEEVSAKISVNESHMSALVSTEMDITLSGRGWIYLSEEESGGIEYVGRHYSGDSTVYTFLPESVGTVVLEFQFQDLVSNNHLLEKITLSVLPNDSDIDKETASLSVDVESTDTIHTPDLEESLFTLLSENDGSGVSEIFPRLIESTLPSIRQQFPEIAELLYNSSYFVQSAFILEEILNNEVLYVSMDHYLFLLGNIYEKDSSIRNEHTSAAYYKKLVDGYPSSVYWDESQDRYRFLKRRYIDIR